MWDEQGRQGRIQGMVQGCNLAWFGGFCCPGVLQGPLVQHSSQSLSSHLLVTSPFLLSWYSLHNLSW